MSDRPPIAEARVVLEHDGDKGYTMTGSQGRWAFNVEFEAPSEQAALQQYDRIVEALRAVGVRVELPEEK